MKIIVFIAISIITAGSGQLLLRAGALENAHYAKDLWNIQEWIKLLVNLKIILGLIFWSVSTLAYLVILSQAELSFVYCLGSLNYIIVPWLSHWLFKESISFLQVIGMILIFIGVALSIYGKYTGYLKV